MKPSLYIVSRDRLDLFEEIRRRVADTPAVEVVLDRRIADRRRGNRPFGTASMRNDRRQLSVAPQLRAAGWALVTAEQRAAIPPHVPIHLDLGMSGVDDDVAE